MGAQLAIAKKYYFPSLFDDEYYFSTAHFNDLPEDCQLLIFSLFDFPTQLCFRAVCRSWRCQIESNFFKPVCHLSLLIIDPESTPILKSLHDDNDEGLRNVKQKMSSPRYEYFANNAEFGLTNASFLYVNDIADSLASPPNIQNLIDGKPNNQTFGNKTHRLIKITEQKHLPIENNKESQKQVQAFSSSFCAMLEGTFKNKLKKLTIYAARRHLPATPPYASSDYGWSHYKYVYAEMRYNHKLRRQLREYEDGPYKPMDNFLAAVFRTLAGLNSISLYFDCACYFQLSSMSEHIQALAEHQNLTELHVNCNMGYSRCLFKPPDKDEDDDDEKPKEKHFPLFQKLIPNLGKFSIRGQFDIEQMMTTLESVSSKMKELKLTRSVFGNVHEDDTDKILSLPAISTITSICWSVFNQKGITKCVHLYPNVEKLTLEICQIPFKKVPPISLDKLAKLQNLNEFAIISFERLNINMLKTVTLPTIKKLLLVQSFIGIDNRRTDHHLLYQFYLHWQAKNTNDHDNNLDEFEENDETSRISLDITSFATLIKSTFPNLSKLYMAGYLHEAEYNTALLDDKLKTFIPFVKLYFRDPVTQKMTYSK